MKAQNPGEDRDGRQAEKVMSEAKDFSRVLSSKNIFKPKALAMVSHNDQWSVGSSIAVSQFLRPLCLLRRIGNFKQSLKKAMVFYQPLDTANNQNWSSHAFRTGLDGSPATKPPCQNCTTIFAKLEGFIKHDTFLGACASLSDEENKRHTFLGACAEYCPVDQLLEDKSVSDEENKRINDALEQNMGICKRYFTNFQRIQIKEWNEALEKIRVVFKEHLFGLRPQCNDHFVDRSRCPYI